MEQNTFRDSPSHQNENGSVLQGFDITSNQEEDDMKFLSHSDLIDLNINELNNLLTGNDQIFVPTEKEYFLHAYNIENNTNPPAPVYFNNELLNNFNNHRYKPAAENLLTKEALQGKTVNLDPTKHQTYFVPRINQPQDTLLSNCSMLNDSYDMMPMLSSTIKSPDKNYLLIPVNEDIENSTMLQNCKSINLNTEVLNKIDSASAGRSGVLLPLQMDTSNDSIYPNIKRKTPIRVVRSFTTNRIVTSKNKSETSTSTGSNETTNITVHQTINIYEDAADYSVTPNLPSKIRKRKQSFEYVKQLDDSVFHTDIEPPETKRPIKEEELTRVPIFSIQQLPTTPDVSQTLSLTDVGIDSMIKHELMDKSPVIPKKKMNLKKNSTEKCPKCNQLFKKLSVHIGRCKFDASLIVQKEATKITNETIESFICEICLKSFRNEKILSSHKLGHNKLRCKLCTKVHSSEKELNKHLELCGVKAKKSYIK